MQATGRTWDSLRAGGAVRLSRCQVCGRWPAQAVCAACVARFVGPVVRCPTCALQLPPAADPRQPCGACLTRPPPWRACGCVLDYAYPWHGMIQRFKYGAEPAWAQTFARLAHDHAAWHTTLAEAETWLLPIPLATDRLVQRGYNQSALWAQALMTTLDRAQRLRVRHLPDGLLRLGHTAEQIGRTRAQREQAVRAAFVANPRHLAGLQGQSVWLLDDVMTTGATLHAATNALLRAGVASVRVACVARTPAPDDG